MNIKTATFGLIYFLFAISVGLGSDSAGRSDHEAAVAGTQEAYGQLPLFFIRNDGQLDDRVEFFEKGNGHSMYFTSDAIYLALTGSRDGDRAGQTETVRLAFVNGSPDVKIAADEELEGKVNYLIGADPEKWRSDVPSFGSLIYREVYPGIDAKFYGNNRELEYDIIVNPGADPEEVGLFYEGIEGLRVTGDGELEISLEHGKIMQRKPCVYQEVDGKRVEVKSAFTIREEPEFSYGFDVANYDRSLPLVIDPILSYSTYLGGSGGESGVDIALDASGNIYLTGHTESTDFPVVTPIQGTFGGTWDVIVTKMDASGSNLIFSTYLGGSDHDTGQAIALDSSGNVYVTGYTRSADFPTASPYQGTFGGDIDGFVAKITASGTSLAYSTYLGTNVYDICLGIAVDSSGNACVAGATESPDFPVVAPIQGSLAGYIDVIVTKFDATGSSLLFSTYLGGVDSDSGKGIALDPSGNVYVIGYTASNNFPVASPIQGIAAGWGDAFVTKIDTSSSSLVYSTYLGGSDFDYGVAVDVDSAGNAYVTGYTKSLDFPTASPIQGTIGGNQDGYVAKISSAGSSLIYSTYLGGSLDEFAGDIAVDSTGGAYVTGFTESTDFPTAAPVQAAHGGGEDAFVTKITSSGSALGYSTCLGGSDDDRGRGIAVDLDGNAHILGYTYSADFPTASPLQGTLAGDADVFISRLSPPPATGLLVAGYHTMNLLQFDGATGSYNGEFVSAGSGGLSRPRGMCFGPGGDLYVGDSDTDAVLRFDGKTGAYIDTFVPAGSGGLNWPCDLVFGSDDNLYVASWAGILRFDGQTGAYLDTFVPLDYGVQYVLDSPSTLAFGPDGNLYVGDMNNGSVVRFDRQTGSYIDDFVPPYSGGLDAPRDLVFGPDGNLYVSSLCNGGSVLRFDGTTGAYIDAFVSAGSGGLGQPEGLVFGNDGNLYVSSFDSDSVLRYDGQTGAPIDVFVTSGSGGLDGPLCLAFFPEPSLDIDIKANGSDGPVALDQGDSLVVTISLDPAGQEGDDADWWILAKAPSSWYHHNLGGSWSKGIAPSRQGPLLTVDSHEVFNGTGLPVGTFRFYFGVDMDMNGQVDMEQMFHDSVKVTVN